MSMKPRLTILAAMLTALAAGWACSTSKVPTAKSLAQDAITAMGGTAKLQSIRTITMKGGTGTREQLQESVHVGDQEAPAKLSKVTEIVDLAGGRASFDYEIDNAGFMQHR